jgi:hypothetical protein
MSYYTVTQPTQLVVVNDPTQLLSAISGNPSGPQLNVGDLVTTADPPKTMGTFIQVTTGNGQTGWVSQSAVQAGVMGSTPANIGIIAIIGLGIWWLWRSR